MMRVERKEGGSLFRLKAGACMAVLLTAAVLFCLDAPPVFSAPDSEDGPAGRSPALTITVNAVSEIGSDRICLKDIAGIEGGDEEVRSRAGMILLGSAPRAGREKKVPGSRLSSAVRSKRWIPENVVLVIPDSVTVKRASQEIDYGRLNTLFENYLTPFMNGAEYRISQFRVRGRKDYPCGKMDLKVVSGSKKTDGRVNIRVGVFVDGTDRGRLVLSAWVDRYENLVCAARPLAKGTVLTENDLCLMRKNTAKVPSDVVNEIETAAGKRLKQNLVQGGVVREKLLGPLPLVYKDSPVKIIVRAGALKVVTAGVAQRDGGMDELVMVKNVKSRKIITGRVSGPSQVEVLF